jgi:Protein of unknown function (DUF2939)
MADVTNPESPNRPRRRGKLIAAIVVAMLLIYAASPYYSVWRFGEALRAHDMEALAARVDFHAVRGSLKQQIRDHFLGVLAKKKKDRLAQFLTAATDDPLGRLIDAYVTPEGLAAIISDPAPIKNASSLSSLPSLDGSRGVIDWSKAHHAFFTGPRDFAVDHQGIKLLFRFDGFGWKLHALDLELPATKPQE